MINTEQTTPRATSPINGEEFGNIISDKLSDLLRKYTNKNDRADISLKTDMSSSTLRGVVFRNNSLTENNSKGLIELLKIAIKRCKTINEDSEQDELDLLDFIK